MNGEESNISEPVSLPVYILETYQDRRWCDAVKSSTDVPECEFARSTRDVKFNCFSCRPNYVGRFSIFLLYFLTPIRERVKFKMACLVRQSLSGQVPLYLADDCCLVSDSTRRSLWSADIPTCVMPRTLSSYGDRTFAAAAPRLWYSLPIQLRNPDISRRIFVCVFYINVYTWMNIQ